MRSHKINFTKGEIIGPLIAFMIPMLLSELFQNFYNSVDAAVAGRYLGKDALGAISISGTITSLIIGFFTGMATGVSIIVSRYFGSGDELSRQRSMRVSFSFSTGLGLILSALGCLLTPQLLRLTGAKEGIFDQGVIYVRIYMIGILFTIMYNTGAGILRALGDSNSPFYMLVATGITNMVLDISFVKYLHWGIAGAAIATVLAQAVSVALVYRKLREMEPSFGFSFAEVKDNLSIVGEFMSFGIPTGIQNSLISISNVFVWRYINGFDASVVAGIGVAQRLDRFIAMPSKAFSQTVTTFVGQNYGAMNAKRARKGVGYTMALGIGITLALSAIVWALGRSCVSLFTDELDVQQVAIAMMYSIIPLYFTMAGRQILAGALRGFGDKTMPTVYSLLGMIAVRQLFLAVSMSISHTPVNIYYCYPVGWGSTFILVTLRYLRLRGRFERELNEKALAAGLDPEEME
jgi:putative MATE family efflux protein